MTKLTARFLAFAGTLLLFAASANAETLTANFDSFSEGAFGTVVQDGGITFSNLDTRLPGMPAPNLLAIDNTNDPSFVSPFTPANFLSMSGYSAGPAAGIGRIGSLDITFGNTVANEASMYLAHFGLRFNNVLNLEARLNGILVGTSSVEFLNDTPRAISISGVTFDSLRLNVTGTDEGGVLFFGIDSVNITTIPEPTSLVALSAIGAVAFLRYRRTRRTM